MTASSNTIQLKDSSLLLFKYARFFQDPTPIAIESVSPLTSNQVQTLSGLYLQKVVIPLEISPQDLITHFPDLSISGCARRCAHLLIDEGKEEWLLVQEALEQGTGDSWIKKIDEQCGRASPKAQAARAIIAILNNPPISQLLLKNLVSNTQVPSETDAFAIRMNLLLENSHVIHNRVASEVFETVAQKLGFEPALLAEQLPKMTLGELCRWGIVQQGITQDFSDPIQHWDALQKELCHLSESRGFDTVLYSPWLRDLPLESFCKQGTDPTEAQIKVGIRLEEYRTQVDRFYRALKTALDSRARAVSLTSKKQKRDMFMLHAKELLTALDGHYILPKLSSLRINLESFYKQSLAILVVQQKKCKGSAIALPGSAVNHMGDILKHFARIQKEERELFDRMARRRAEEAGKELSELEVMTQSETLRRDCFKIESINSDTILKNLPLMGLSPDLMQEDPFFVLEQVVEKLAQFSAPTTSKKDSAALPYQEIVNLTLLFKSVTEHLEYTCSMTPLSDPEVLDTTDDATWFEEAKPRLKQKMVVAKPQPLNVVKRPMVATVEEHVEEIPILEHSDPIDRLVQRLDNRNSRVHATELVHCLELLQKEEIFALFALSHLHLFLEQLLKPSADSQEHHLGKLTQSQDPLLKEHALDSVYLRYPVQIRQRLQRVYSHNPLAIDGPIALLAAQKLPDGFAKRVEQDGFKALRFAADLLGIEPPAQLSGIAQDAEVSIEEQDTLALEALDLRETVSSLIDQARENSLPAMQDATYHLIALQQLLLLFVNYPHQRYIGLFAHHMVESLSLFFELTAFAKSGEFTHHNLERDLLAFPDVSQATQSTVKKFNVQKKLHYPDLITNHQSLAPWIQELRLLSSAAASGEEGFLPVNWKGGTPTEERQRLLLQIGRGVTAAQEWISHI